MLTFFAGRISNSTAPSAKHSFYLVALENKIYAIGGKIGDNAQNSVDIYDIATDAWESAQSKSSAIQCSSVIALNGEIEIIRKKLL